MQNHYLTMNDDDWDKLDDGFKMHKTKQEDNQSKYAQSCNMNRSNGRD